MIRRLPVPAAVALVALGLAACGGPLAPAAPAASAAATPATLPAGTYTSVNFQPAVTFTVPDGWVLAADEPFYLSLHPIDSDQVGVHLFRDPSAASQDPTCPPAAEPGVGKASTDLVAWIRNRPGLVVGAPAMATIGGWPATALDVGVAAGWTKACPFANGVPSVPLFNSPGIDHWVVVGDERLRLYLLDLPGAGTVAVDLDAFQGDAITDLLDRSAVIVRSLKFAAPAASGGSAPASSAPAPASGPASAPAASAPAPSPSQ